MTLYLFNLIFRLDELQKYQHYFFLIKSQLALIHHRVIRHVNQKKPITWCIKVVNCSVSTFKLFAYMASYTWEPGEQWIVCFNVENNVNIHKRQLMPNSCPRQICRHTRSRARCPANDKSCRCLAGERRTNERRATTRVRHLTQSNTALLPLNVKDLWDVPVCFYKE